MYGKMIIYQKHFPVKMIGNEHLCLENAHLPKTFPWKNDRKMIIYAWENDHLPKAFPMKNDHLR